MSSPLVVLAQNVPADGVNGPSLLHSLINLPEDYDKPCNLKIIEEPKGGEFTVSPLGGFTFVAPPGVYTLKFIAFVGGMRRGGVHTRVMRIKEVA